MRQLKAAAAPATSQIPAQAISASWTSASDGRPGTARGTLTRTTALPELVHVVHILRLLDAEPIGKTALCEAVGSQWGNVARLVNECRRVGLVRIADWSVRLHGGSRGALFALGSGPDAPRPPGRCPVLAANLAQLLGQRAEDLRGVGSSAHARGVGLGL